MSLDPAEWAKKLADALTDADKAVLAEAHKVATAVRIDALKIRRSKLGEEIAQIEADLAALLPHKPARSASKASQSESATKPATHSDAKPAN